EQHALEEGESAGAVDDDTGDVVAAGDERRGDAAQAQAEDDDAPAVDLGRGGEALEGEAVVGELGRVVELVAAGAFAVAAGRALDAQQHHAGALGELAEQAPRRIVAVELDRAAG